MKGRTLALQTKRKVSGGVALVKALEANDIHYTFGIPGVHTLDAYDALIDSDFIDTILPRHEQGAGFMADGYARVTGRPGVALVVTGPGITNVSTAVGEAYADSSKVLVIATNLEREYLDKLEGNLHEMTDQMAFMKPITKWSKRVMEASDIPATIAEALTELESGRPRPVYVEIPLDVLSEEFELDELPVAKPLRVAPEPSAIDRAAEAIASANRIFILAGGGAVDAETNELLSEFATLTGAAVSSSLMGKGAIAEDHPQALGAFGYRWSDQSPVVPFMKGSDLAIAIGTGLGVRTTANASMPLPDKLIHIDIDASEIGKRYDTAVSIPADAALTLTALLEKVRHGGTPQSVWTPEEIAIARSENFTPTDERSAKFVQYIHAVRNAMDRDGILINDMTMMSYEAVRYFPVLEPRSYTFPRGFGTLGSSVPTAIGAKIAQPNRQVVSMNGDGGIQFTLTELGAAVHHKVPVPFIIFNDGTHTAVKAAQHRTYPGRFIDVDLVNPDYVKIAEAYGIQGLRANSPEELNQILQSVLRNSDMPVVIDVPINLERYD